MYKRFTNLVACKNIYNSNFFLHSPNFYLKFEFIVKT